MDNLGAIVGPLPALALVSVVTIRETILLSVIPGLLAAGAIYFAIRAAPRLGQAGAAEVQAACAARDGRVARPLPCRRRRV